ATPALLGPSRFLEQPADREDSDPDGRHNQKGLEAGPVAGVPRDRHRQKDHSHDLEETPQLVEEHTSFLPAKPSHSRDARADSFSRVQESGQLAPRVEEKINSRSELTTLGF